MFLRKVSQNPFVWSFKDYDEELIVIYTEWMNCMHDAYELVNPFEYLESWSCSFISNFENHWKNHMGQVFKKYYQNYCIS